MRNKLLSVILILQIVVFVFINPILKDNLKYNINVYKDSNLDSIKLENYVIGVVAAEMPATFSIEALKAQAVASRTFAYKKIVDGVLSYDNLEKDQGQAYITIEQMHEKWKDNFESNYQIISSVVLSTKGEIITYEGKPINSYYFSISNGKTENASNVFGEENYLISVDSSWDINNNNYENNKKIDVSKFKNVLGIVDNNINVGDITRNETNHVNSIVINNKNYDGIEIRRIFNLRSTDFEINVDNNFVDIKTRGYGHGVGMSQYGANSLGNKGKTYEEIIKYYYTGVTIEKI